MTQSYKTKKRRKPRVSEDKKIYGTATVESEFREPVGGMEMPQAGMQ